MPTDLKDIPRSEIETLLKEMDQDPENDPDFHTEYDYWNGYLGAIAKIKSKFSI